MQKRGILPVIILLSGLVFSMLTAGTAAAQSDLDDAVRAVAQRQLDAFNAHDLEAYLAVFAEDVEVYQFPNTLKQKGRENIRQVYADLFARAPEVHVELAARIVKGNIVIDHEIVTHAPGDLKMVAIFEIEGDQIKRFWFIP